MVQHDSRGDEHHVRIEILGHLISGNGIGVYLIFYDANGTVLASDEGKDKVGIILSKESSDWKEYVKTGSVPSDAVNLRLWVHSFSESIVTAAFDDFSVLLSK